MNFKNMKIEINDEQPLDDVEGELRRLGFFFNCGCDDKSAKMVTANTHYMQYDIYSFVTDSVCNTTLQQLREMK